MSCDWPGQWHPKVSNDDSVTMTNDGGIVWLTDDIGDGEWLKIWGDVPENTC